MNKFGLLVSVTMIYTGLFGCVASVNPEPIMKSYDVYAYSDAELENMFKATGSEWNPQFNHPTDAWSKNGILTITVFTNVCGGQYIDKSLMVENLSGNLIELQYAFSDKNEDTVALCCSPNRLTYRMVGLTRKAYKVRVTTIYSKTYKEATAAMPLPID